MNKYRVFAGYDAGFYVDIVANSATDAEAEMMGLINDNDVPENAVIINRDYFITSSEVTDMMTTEEAIDKCETALVEMTDLYYTYATADRLTAKYASTAEDAIMRLIEHLQEGDPE
tara:strand:+ start:1116 stop:1463 length:348 start_codon:yes stop_codon:yes gene_type:complete